MYLQNRWYVATQSKNLGTNPMAFQLLNEQIVIFRKENGGVVALEDRCVHRQAPLSRGEVVGDLLQCAYHGLCFDGSGNCVRVPSQKVIPPNARIRHYPAIERHGLIFIWMGLTDEPDIEALYIFPWDEDENWHETHIHLHAHFSYLLLVDNLMDLSHLAYLHKSTIGIDAVAEDAKQKSERAGERVRVSRWMAEIDQAPTHIELSGYTGKVDRWQYIEFCPPGYFWVQTGSAMAGKGGANAKGKDLLIKRNSVHIVVPETETTTNYYYTTVHKKGTLSEEREQIFKDRMAQTFREDVELLEHLSRQARPESPKIDLAADAGALQVRSILDGLIAAQTNQEFPDQRSPNLT